MSDLEIMGQLEDLEKRLRRQEAKPSGPSLGEFYGQFQGLPGLRGLWYPGSLDQTGAMYDQSGQGRTLTYNGNPALGLYNNLVPYMAYDGTGDFHSRADEAGLDISGTETTIASGLRGHTMLIIARPVALVTDRAWGGKNNPTGNQRAWHLSIDGATNTRLNSIYSQAGTANHVAQSDAGVLATDQWYVAAQRLVPGVSNGVFVNGQWWYNNTSVPTSVFNSTADFRVGNRASANTDFSGHIALVALAAAAWPDALINYLWQRSRVLFNV